MNARWTAQLACVLALSSWACGGSSGGKNGPPVIHAFTSSKPFVPVGETLTLSWTVEGATSLSVSGVGAVSGSSVNVSPSAATTYVLTAKNAKGETKSSPLTLELGPRLEVSGGVMINGGQLGSVLLVRARETSGSAPGSEVSVSVTELDGKATGYGTFRCQAGMPCVARFPGVPPPLSSGKFRARATLEGKEATADFEVSTSDRLSAQGPIAVTFGSGSTFSASWLPVPGATHYQVQLFDFDRREPASAPQTVSGTQAALTAFQAPEALGSYGVVLEAASFELGATTLPDPLPIPRITRTLAAASGPRAGVSWQLFAPSDYAGDTLTVSLASLDASDRLAVLPLNVAGADESTAQLSVAGTGVQPVSSVVYLASGLEGSAPAEDVRADRAAPVEAGHEEARARQGEVVEWLATHQPAGPPEPEKNALTFRPDIAPALTTFCVQSRVSHHNVRKSASLKRETAHALIYVDDEDAASYAAHDPFFWDSLASVFETNIHGAVTGSFGAPSDLDGNGKLIVFLTSELGPMTSSGLVLGYFWGGDLSYAKDTSSTCSLTGSNQADMFYLNDIENVLSVADTVADAVSDEYPGVLAHELQHLINFNERCLLRVCYGSQEVWVDEGLARVSEDVAGFGWNTPDGRSSGAKYLERLGSGAVRGYSGRGLTVWEGDPIGNYEGAHAFFRYWADRTGGSVLKSLVQTTLTGRQLVEDATGQPFARAMADWVTALTFSNEAFSPGAKFNYPADKAWTPLHTKLRGLDYLSLNPGSPQTAALRVDGWSAYVTGAGTGQPVTLTVTSSAAVKPHVVVVRFTGDLSR